MRLRGVPRQQCAENQIGDNRFQQGPGRPLAPRAMLKWLVVTMPAVSTSQSQSQNIGQTQSKRAGSIFRTIRTWAGASLLVLPQTRPTRTTTLAFASALTEPHHKEATRRMAAPTETLGGCDDPFEFDQKGTGWQTTLAIQW